MNEQKRKAAEEAIYIAVRSGEKFVNALRHDVRHMNEGLCHSRKMLDHAQVCMSRACDMYRGLSYTREGNKLTVRANVQVKPRRYRRKLVVTIEQSYHHPGKLQVTAYVDGGLSGARVVSCINDLAVEYQLREAIVSTLSLYTLAPKS